MDSRRMHEPAVPSAAPSTRSPAGSSVAKAVLLVALGLTMVLGIAGLGVGAWMVVTDLADTSDEWHGLGIVLGLFAAVPGLLAVVLGGLALWWRRRAPQRTRLLAGFLGAVLMLSYAMVASIGSAVTVPLVVLGLTLLVLSLLSRDTREGAGRFPV